MNVHCLCMEDKDLFILDISNMAADERSFVCVWKRTTCLSLILVTWLLMNVLLFVLEDKDLFILDISNVAADERSFDCVWKTRICLSLILVTWLLMNVLLFVYGRQWPVYPWY